MKWEKPEKFQSGFGSFQMSAEGGYCITFQKTSAGNFVFVPSRHKLDFGRLVIPGEATREDLGKAAAMMRVLCESFDELEVKA